MMKYFNELTKREQLRISMSIRLQIRSHIKSIVTLADQYDLNREELFELIQLLEKQYVEKTGIDNVKSLTDKDTARLMSAAKKLIDSFEKVGNNNGGNKSQQNN